MTSSTLDWMEEEAARCTQWLEAHGVDPGEPLLENLPDPTFRLQGREMVTFASNNYLDLARRPEVLAAAQAALRHYSAATTESRRLGGTIPPLAALEREIADFKGRPAAAIFATGLLTNVGAIPALLNVATWCEKIYAGPSSDTTPRAILLDELSHRSIQVGAQLAGVPVARFRHNDMEHLAQRLAEHAGQRLLVITDGVFSMDGDLAPLERIAPLCTAHGAALMVDDAHGTGVFGASGRGIEEHFGLSGAAQVSMGTFSKALGGMGGFIATGASLVRFLKLSATGYRFTSSLPAEQAAAILAALAIVRQENGPRARLWGNVGRLYRGLHERHLTLPGHWSPIVPLRFRNDAAARTAEAVLDRAGLFCPAITFPLVPRDAPRLRITLNASHTPAHLARLLEAIAAVQRQVGGALVGAGGQNTLPPAPAYLASWVGEG